MNYKFETINCVLCGNNNIDTISTKGKFGLPTNVVLCKECGLGYLNPRWNAESYLHFYQHEYDTYYRPNLLSEHYDDKEKINPVADRLRQFNLFPSGVHNILDIGSGEGTNLKYFKQLFPETDLYAIEPSVESQKRLKEFGVTILGDDVDKSWDTGIAGKYDVIIMRHVLEHFMNPIPVLEKVRKVLSETGIVYIAVPNNLNPIQNLTKSWFRNVHTFYYNKFSFQNLSDLVGLEVLQLVEGDHFNKGELFMIARKGERKLPVVFSKEHYRIQRSVFKKKLNAENNSLTKGIKLIKRGLQKIFPSAKKI